VPNPNHDLLGRFAEIAATAHRVRKRKRPPSDKAIERLDAKFQRHPVKYYGPIKDRGQPGGRYHVSVVRNAAHYAERQEPKYYAQSTTEHGVTDDARGSHKLASALRHGASMHNYYRKAMK
jgi:hypothetical protein